MRVLVVSDQWAPEDVGGSARVAAGSARALAARGHEVTIVAPTAQAAARLERKGFLPRSLADLTGSRHAARRLGARFDVVLGHQSTTALGAAVALGETPLALVFHASAAREERFRRSRGGTAARVAGLARTPMLAAFERAAVGRARRIVVLSDFSRRLVEADHPRAAARVRLVGAGVDAGRFQPGDRAAARERLGLGDGPLLVTVRRLEPRMGVDVLLQVLARLPDHNLAVVGTGPEEGRLRALTDSLGLASRVRFAGRAPEAELPDWYRAADLFVLPTLAYEGFGVATAEALVSGTPVVGTRAGATPELLEPLDPGLLADTPSPEALAEAVERGLSLAADPAFRSRCRDYAVGRFSWEAAAESWEAALEEAAAAARALRTTAAAGARA